MAPSPTPTCPKPKGCKLFVVVERLDHHCGDDLMSVNNGLPISVEASDASMVEGGHNSTDENKEELLLNYISSGFANLSATK